MKSNWITYFLVIAALLFLAVDKRLDLLAVVAPLSIAVSWAMIARQHSGTTSVEYRHKR